MKRYNILIIEDNLGDLVLLEDFLDETSLASDITSAKDFYSAKSLLSQAKNNFDIIFLDLSLPDKNGLELVEEVENLANDKPIIILTGYQDANFAVKSLSLGASDYLVKDVLNPTVLSKSILYNIERNKILVNLKDSEQRYADLFHFSPLPMWVFDRETLKFMDVNDATVDHYGYSFEEFMEMDITQIRPKEELPAFYQSMKIKKEPYRNLYVGEFIHSKKNGEKIKVEVRSNCFQFKGRPAELILVNDITERSQHIEAIERQNDILREIAWTQSHVVRAPLARLMGLVKAMKDNRFKNNDKEMFFDHILKSADELDQIIKSVVNKSQGVKINNKEDETGVPFNR